MIKMKLSAFEKQKNERKTDFYSIEYKFKYKFHTLTKFCCIKTYFSGSLYSTGPLEESSKLNLLLKIYWEQLLLQKMVHVLTEKCAWKLAVDCASFQASLQPLDRSRAPIFKQTGLALGSEMSGVKRKCGYEAAELSLPIKLKAFIIKLSKMHKNPKFTSDSVEA